MAKCIRCGKSTALRGHVKISDADLCGVCFKELGFERNDVLTASLYKYDEIKDGRDAYYFKRHKAAADKYDQDHADKYDMSLTHYQQLDNAGATDNEKKIFSAICSALEDEGYDTDLLQVRLGDNGSLLVMVDGVVMVQYKSEPQVKWIRFPNESDEKIRIGGVGRINSMTPRLVEAYRSAIG